MKDNQLDSPIYKKAGKYTQERNLVVSREHMTKVS
jgi:hypothetical protein